MVCAHGGMHCSLCVESIRKALNHLPGVLEVYMSIAQGEALIRYEPAQASPADFLRTLEALRFAVYPAEERAAIAQEEQELRAARSRALAAGIALTMAAMMAVMGMGWRMKPGWMAGQGAVALFLALGPARFVLRNGWESLRRGILNQDVLVLAAATAGLIGGVLGWRMARRRRSRFDFSRREIASACGRANGSPRTAWWSPGAPPWMKAS